MPRELVLGNAKLLVGLDGGMNLRDLYYPLVGQWNHIGGHRISFGFWIDGQFAWCDDPAWQFTYGYESHALVAHAEGAHPGLALRLALKMAVHHLDNVFLQEMTVTNLAERSREVRVFFTHDFTIQESDVGDTAVYDPEIRAIYHYKRSFYFLANGQAQGKGLAQFATGIKRFRGAEGTWRDAEDGTLSGNPIAQGSVDSTIGFHLHLAPGQAERLHYWLACGKNYQEICRLNASVLEKSPATLLSRVGLFWQHWLRNSNPAPQALPPDVVRLYRTSLCLVRAHMDVRGPIVASTDSDILSFGRDHYAYVWPRDAALVARAMIRADYPDSTVEFFRFCSNAITDRGYLLHKYNPDGTAGSSWHPWYHHGEAQLPIQEDETALVLVALWQHFRQQRNLEFLQSLFRSLVEPAATFLCQYRDPATGLPLPSYDLWEEQRGVWTFTAAAVHGGLVAAARIARLCANEALAELCRETAASLHAAILTHLYDPRAGRFLKGLRATEDGRLVPDATPESSTLGVYLFGLLPARDPRVVSTARALERELWVKTPVGGLARYAGDNYFRPPEAGDQGTVPGNPWLICTLWLTQWYTACAETAAELERPLELLRWAAARANQAGILPEQVHPFTGQPLSVAPLTWSHSTFVEAVLQYRHKYRLLRRLGICALPSPGRRRSPA